VIDLCVVNHNTRPLLQRQLNALHSDYREGVWNLYISDNGSSDDTVQWLNRLRSSYQIKDFFENENVGYSAACNSMVKNGQSEIVALLNADTWFTTSDLLAVQKLFDDDADVHIFGPKQRDENGYITHAGIIGTNTSPKMRGWREHDPTDQLYKDRVNCVTVSGSAYFVRRDVWEAMTNNEMYQLLVPDAVGAFLPTPHYYEETWCSYFARHLGYNVVYDGSISIGHSWHKSSPIGGEADRKFSISQKIFRDACDYFGIERD